VKIAILDILLLEFGDRAGLAGFGGAHQVVPSEDLMKDNAVNKSTESEAKNQSSGGKGRELH
jgi:hypothetical protein